MGTIRPVYLLAGGGGLHRKSPDPLIVEMLQATGSSSPSVAYFGAASHDNHQFFAMIRTILKQAGAGQVVLVPLAEPSSDLKKAQTLIQASDVLFFSGGDVELGMQILHARGIIGLIRERYKTGAVFGGLSAGSILLAQQWVRWRDPSDDDTAEPFDCLGIVPVICDMHDENDGWEELKMLLSLRQNDGEIGYGIPASAGLCIHPDSHIEFFGKAPHRFVFRKKRGVIAEN